MSVRTGRISSINYAEGTAQVTFPDADDSVSGDYPFLAGSYRAPSVGDTVQILEDATGPERGVILGSAYSKKNPPPEGGAGLFRLDLGDGIFLRQQGGTVTLDVSGKNLVIKCGTLDFVADDGELTVKNIAFTTHTHAENGGETDPPTA